MNLILTGTMKPASNYVYLTDEKQRFQDYTQAIISWSKIPEIKRIIFIDTNNYVFDKKFVSLFPKLETYSIDASYASIPHGKSKGESIGVLKAIELSKLEDTDCFYKCTGRLFVNNFADFLKYKDMDDIQFNLLGYWRRHIDTRFFKCSVKLFKELLSPLTEQMHDPEKSIETVYYNAFVFNGSTFPPKSEIVGRSGSTNILYLSYPQGVIDEAKVLTDKFFNGV